MVENVRKRLARLTNILWKRQGWVGLVYRGAQTTKINIHINKHAHVHTNTYASLLTLVNYCIASMKINYIRLINNRIHTNTSAFEQTACRICKVLKLQKQGATLTSYGTYNHIG